MPISEDHPAVEAGVEADFLWNKASPAEAVAAILNAALPHLRPEDVPHIRNALLDELAEEARTFGQTLALDEARDQAQKAAAYLDKIRERERDRARQQKEPRDV